MVRLLKTNGKVVDNVKAKTLEQKQKLVGGYIGLVRLDNSYMIVNEEGDILKLPKNKRASHIANIDLTGDVIHVTGEDVQNLLD